MVNSIFSKTYNYFIRPILTRLNYFFSKIRIFHSSSMEDAPKVLKKTNNLFLESYAQRKENTLKTLGKETPVFLISGDEVILHYQGNRNAVTYIPQEYHDLKAVAHISSLIHTIFGLRKEGKNQALQIEKNANKQIETLLKNDHLKEYRNLLTQYKNLLNQEQQSLTDLKDPLNELIKKAARIRLEALNAYVNKFRKEIPQNHWDQVSVVVMGPQMPRHGELSMQYFCSILKSSAKEDCPTLNNLKGTLGKKRLVYAEGIFNEQEALKLLVTHIRDEDMGKGIFGDANLMYGDILKDATKDLLPTVTG